MTAKKVISLNQVVSMRFPQTVLWFYYHGKDLCYTVKILFFCLMIMWKPKLYNISPCGAESRMIRSQAWLMMLWLVDASSGDWLLWRCVPIHFYIFQINSEWHKKKASDRNWFHWKVFKTHVKSIRRPCCETIKIKTFLHKPYSVPLRMWGWERERETEREREGWG